jgi:hypothetical protein
MKERKKARPPDEDKGAQGVPGKDEGAQGVPDENEGAQEAPPQNEQDEEQEDQEAPLTVDEAPPPHHHNLRGLCLRQLCFLHIYDEYDKLQPGP